jgi:hypothetical protein
VVLKRAASEPFLGEPDPFEHPFGHFRPGADTARSFRRSSSASTSSFLTAASDDAWGWGGALPFLGSDEEAEPEGPVPSQGGGGGSDDYWESSFWLWPLPPPGPLAFVVEWPAKGSS